MSLVTTIHPQELPWLSFESEIQCVFIHLLLVSYVLSRLQSAKTTGPHISCQLPRKLHVLPRHFVTSSSLCFPHDKTLLACELYLIHDSVCVFTWNISPLKTETSAVLFTRNWLSPSPASGTREDSTGIYSVECVSTFADLLPPVSAHCLLSFLERHVGKTWREICVHVWGSEWT